MVCSTPAALKASKNKVLAFFLPHRGSQLLRRERRHGNASALAMQRLPGTWFSVTLPGRRRMKKNTS
jgi:hypothetical protein